MNIQNHGGLLIDADTNSALGYLMEFPGHGVYSPSGKVEVPPVDVDIHNRTLSAAEIKGLDACQVGQYGSFYYTEGKVKTWVGELVSADVSVQGQTITFKRLGRTYRGRLAKDSSFFNFRRVSGEP